MSAQSETERFVHWLAVAALAGGLALGGCSPDGGEEEAPMGTAPEGAGEEAGMAEPPAQPEEAEPPAEAEQADAGQATDEGTTTMAAADAGRTGEAVYQSYCKGCHATGAAGAPKLDDAAAWEPRLAKGDDVLFEHTKNGYKGMPPMGGCTTCTDQELRASIDYMKQQIPTGGG
jgi:cytochrome c5